MLFGRQYRREYANLIVDRSMKVGTGQARPDRQNEEDCCFGAIGAYASGMMDAAKRAGVKLDLTYETAGNIMDTLKVMWFAGNNPTVAEVIENRKTYVKCLAAYLVLLALNNHNNDYAFGKLSRGLIGGKNDEIQIDYWCGMYSVKMSRKSLNGMAIDEKTVDRYTDDLLFTCVDAIIKASEKYRYGCNIQAEPIIAAYKRITSVDLGDYGFKDIRLGAPVYFN